jgi:hypothetical protein
LRKGINFIPVGSATRRNQAKDVSFEPDESYYIGSRKEHPDLAVEVTISSGSTNKLTKYLRLRIPEGKDSGLKEGNEVRHRKVVTRMGRNSLTEKSHY